MVTLKKAKDPTIKTGDVVEDDVPSTNDEETLSGEEDHHNGSNTQDSIVGHETRMVNCSKLMVIAVIVILAVSISFVAYRITRNQEETEYINHVSAIYKGFSWHLKKATSYLYIWVFVVL
jgi:hypothetical protein